MAGTHDPRQRRTLEPGDEVIDEATGGRYRVLSQIGEGGMGRVFKAELVGPGTQFAIKCNQPIDARNPALVERTRREGEFLKGLRKHPHIVPVLATGLTEGGVFWMVMPLLEGATVAELLSVLGRLALPWVLQIAQAVCSALAAVHEVATHRDIKPDNVFLTRDGRIYVLDFGAAKFHLVGRLTTTGTTLGTIAYSSPEQLSDPERIDGRSDLFSVGVMTFEMLTGKHPFVGDGLLAQNHIVIGQRILTEPPRSLAELAPELPSYVPAIVGRMISKRPEDRSHEPLEAAARAVEIFAAARAELRSRLGEPPPIEHVFHAYDAVLREREAARLATQATEKAPAAPERALPRFGTVLMPQLAGSGTAAPAPPPSPGAPPRSAPAPAPHGPAEPAPFGVATARAAPSTVPMAVTSIAFAPAEPVTVARAAPPAFVPAEPVPAVPPPEPRAPPPEPAPPEAGEPSAPPPNDPPALLAASSAGEEEEVDVDRKLQVIHALAKAGTPESRQLLLDALDSWDDHHVVRGGILVALGFAGDEACLDALRRYAAEDPHPVVRRAAEQAAMRLQSILGLAPEAPELASDVTGEPVAPPAAGEIAATAPASPPSPWALGPPAARPAPREWPAGAMVVLAVAMTLLGAGVVTVLYFFLF